MDFQYAAMALIEDPDSVKDFFDKVADCNISLMEHYVKYHNVGMVLLHDDWGAQRAPFFSIETLLERSYLSTNVLLIERMSSACIL